MLGFATQSISLPLLQGIPDFYLPPIFCHIAPIYHLIFMQASF